MIKNLSGELWKQMQFPGYKDFRKKYAVSNIGRIASYSKDINEDGKILNGSNTSGYRTLNLHVDGGNGTIYIHREAAKAFVPKKSAKYKFVMHINHKKDDNRAKNLQWATQEEVSAHQQKSPQKIDYKTRQASKLKGLKLNATQVKAIRSAIENPKRKLTYKQIADKYDVSEMTIYRIKSGENWASVK